MCVCAASTVHQYVRVSVCSVQCAQCEQMPNNKTHNIRISIYYSKLMCAQTKHRKYYLWRLLFMCFVSEWIIYIFGRLFVEWSDNARTASYTHTHVSIASYFDLILNELHRIKCGEAIPHTHARASPLVLSLSLSDEDAHALNTLGLICDSSK